MRAIKEDYTWAPQQYRDSGGLGFCSVTLFRGVFHNFLLSLDCPYKFKCPHCLDSPRILICDATSTTMQSKFYTGKLLLQNMMLFSDLVVNEAQS